MTRLGIPIVDLDAPPDTIDVGSLPLNPADYVNTGPTTWAELFTGAVFPLTFDGSFTVTGRGKSMTVTLNDTFTDQAALAAAIRAQSDALTGAVLIDYDPGQDDRIFLLFDDDVPWTAGDTLATSDSTDPLVPEVTITAVGTVTPGTTLADVLRRLLIV